MIDRKKEKKEREKKERRKEKIELRERQKERRRQGDFFCNVLIVLSFYSHSFCVHNDKQRKNNYFWHFPPTERIVLLKAR